MPRGTVGTSISTDWVGTFLVTLPVCEEELGLLLPSPPHPPLLLDSILLECGDAIIQL